MWDKAILNAILLGKTHDMVELGFSTQKHTLEKVKKSATSGKPHDMVELGWRYNLPISRKPATEMQKSLHVGWEIIDMQSTYNNKKANKHTNNKQSYNTTKEKRIKEQTMKHPLLLN